MRHAVQTMAVAVGVLAGSALAQPEQATVRVNVEFSGGPMRDYVVALKKAVAPESVNVVISGDSAKVELPPVSLKGASLDSAVMLLEMVEVPQFELDVSVAPDEPGSARVFVVRTRYIGPTPAQREAQSKAEVQTRIEVFSLRELLAAPPGTPADPAGVTTVDTLLTAAQTAMTLGGDAVAPELKFHPDSAVLVVRGSPQQLDGVRQVLGEMRSDLLKYREAAVVARDREAHLLHEFRESQVRLATAESEFRFFNDQYEQHVKLSAAGGISSTELAQGQLEVQRKRSDVESARIRLERAAEALETFRTGGPPAPPPLTLKSADQVRGRIKALEDELVALRDVLKKMESSGPR